MKDFIEKINTIELLAKHEEALADLYLVYSELFPECKAWSFLYGEETKHADWILSILDNVSEGSIEFDDMHFSERSIAISINSLKKHLEEAKNSDINLKQALDKAYFLENSILENKFLDYFFSSDENIQEVIDNLKSDTYDHRDLIQKEKDILKDSD
ncbi:MAG: hypothetical protein JXR48_08480 [Candidatus Delongbacteria bacterium]|nr:hypothetical protein [Candidatus Delongbacteria bacterium]